MDGKSNREETTIEEKSRAAVIRGEKRREGTMTVIAPGSEGLPVNFQAKTQGGPAIEHPGIEGRARGLRQCDVIGELHHALLLQCQHFRSLRDVGPVTGGRGQGDLTVQV